ncbi:MAG: Smr/MutS family protein [Candidatus Peregrinibacteria bacterium]
MPAEPQDKLNLHGYHTPHAQNQAAVFIRGAYQRGLRLVEIVTGRGAHTKGEPVLHDAIQKVIARLAREGIVANYQSISQGGAFWVTLSINREHSQ